MVRCFGGISKGIPPEDRPVTGCEPLRGLVVTLDCESREKDKVMLCKYELSEAGQRAALLAGEPAQKRQTLETDDLEIIKRCLDLGAMICLDGDISLPYGYFTPTLDTRLTDAKEWLAAVEAKHAELEAKRAVEKAEIEARKVEKRDEAIKEIEGIIDDDTPFPAHELERIKQMERLDHLMRYTEELPEDLVKRARTLLDTFKAYRALYQRQVENAVEEFEAGGEFPRSYIPRMIDTQTRYQIDGRIAAERAKRRQTRLAQLIRENHGDARLTIGKGPLGAISEDEALEIVTDLYLPKEIDATSRLPGVMQYRPLTTSNVRAHCEEGAYGEDCEGSISFVVDDENDDDFTLTATEFDTAMTIKQVVINNCRSRGVTIDPDNTLVRVHKGQCSSSDCPVWPARRVGVKFSLECGEGLTISREYSETPAA